MAYFLATYVIGDGEQYEHRGTLIFEAKTAEEAEEMAAAEAYEPGTDNHQSSFRHGDGLTTCKLRDCRKITEGQMRFLERVELAYRK